MHEQLAFDMQDGVMYVTPSGSTFNKEIITEHWNRIKEAFKRIADAAIQAFQYIAEKLKQLFKPKHQNFIIFEEVTTIKNVGILNENRKGWHIPKNIIKPSQVFDKKPRYSNIRNNL